MPDRKEQVELYRALEIVEIEERAQNSTTGYSYGSSSYD